MSAWRYRDEPPAVRGPRRPSHFEYSHVVLTFDNERSSCADWLYQPDDVGSLPVVVMAGEFAVKRHSGPRPYAERLTEAGYATFLFDHRYIGDSDGEPRNLVDPDSQIVDWHIALSRLRGRNEIDSRPLVLWGAEFSGGYTLRAAAKDGRAATVAAQNPMLGGKTATRGRGVESALAALATGVRNRLQSRFLDPYRVPVVGDGSSMAISEDSGVRAVYRDLVPPGSAWRNETPARLFPSLLRYRALPDPDAITCLTLLVSRTRDDLAPTDAVAALADELPDVTPVELPTGHFDHYDRAFERTFGHLLSFLRTIR